jgi:hypothetical protein
LKGGELFPPGFKLNYLIFNAVLVLLTSFLLLGSGIGLLMMKPWARWLSAVSGGILILAPLAEVLFIIMYFNPEMQRLKQEDQEQTSRFYQERGIVVPQQVGPVSSSNLASRHHLTCSPRAPGSRRGPNAVHRTFTTDWLRDYLINEFTYARAHPELLASFLEKTQLNL